MKNSYLPCLIAAQIAFLSTLGQRGPNEFSGTHESGSLKPPFYLADTFVAPRVPAYGKTPEMNMRGEPVDLKYNASRINNKGIF